MVRLRHRDVEKLRLRQLFIDRRLKLWIVRLLQLLEFLLKALF